MLSFYDTSYILIKPIFDFEDSSLVVLNNATLTITTLDPFAFFEGGGSGTFKIYALDSSWVEGTGTYYGKNDMEHGASWVCSEQPAYPVPYDDPPTSWDWRDNGGVTPVKIQDGPTCGLYSAYAALESSYKIFISESDTGIFEEGQHLACADAGWRIDADEYCNDHSSAAHNPLEVFRHLLEFSRVENGGVAFDTNINETMAGMRWVPWVRIAQGDPCSTLVNCYDDSVPPAQVGERPRVPMTWFWKVYCDSIKHIIQAIHYSPICAIKKSMGSHYQSEPALYGDDAPCHDSVVYIPYADHGVLLTGYDSCDCPRSGRTLCYWFKNSWGATWGNDGYGRMASNYTSLGTVGNQGYSSSFSVDTTGFLLPSFIAEPRYWDATALYDDADSVGAFYYSGATEDPPPPYPDSGKYVIGLKTSIVQDMIDGTRPNYGFIIVAPNQTALRIASTQISQSKQALRPSFVITYGLGESEPAIALSESHLYFEATVGGANPDDDYNYLHNIGTGTLTFSAGKLKSWHTITYDGTAPDTIYSSIDIEGLDVGVYEDTVTVTDAESSNSPQTYLVTLTVNADMSDMELLKSIGRNLKTIGRPTETIGR